MTSLWFVLAGCEQPTATPGIDSDVEVTESGSLDTAAADTARVEVPGLAGGLVDEGGAALVGEEVLACTTTTCSVLTTDADGRFGVTLPAPLRLVLKTHPALAVSPRRAAVMYPCILDGLGPVDVGTLVAPSLPRGVQVGWGDEVQALEVGGGLTLSLRRDDLRPPLGAALVDVAAAVVALDRLPALPELGGRPPLAVWAMHPFGAISSTPVGVSFQTTLPAGVEVDVWAISDLDGQLMEPALAVSDGAFVRTADGEGLRRLTWIVAAAR